jgi:GNAT superfamily N-acetyltransferase
MVVFREMSETEYTSWRELAVKEYADDLAEAGYETREHALESSAREFDSMLPKGLKSEGNHLCVVIDEQSSQRVGTIWYMERGGRRTNTIFIGDIRMDEHCRGKGYGAATLKHLEVEARELGKNRIALHVFAHNAGAKKLYEELGYAPGGIMMAKNL